MRTQILFGYGDHIYHPFSPLRCVQDVVVKIRRAHGVITVIEYGYGGIYRVYIVAAGFLNQ
jgi:hypothetical protein